MGIINSIQIKPVYNHYCTNENVDEHCLICNKKLYDETMDSDIENQKQIIVQCFRCNIKLHYLCEKNYIKNLDDKNIIYCIHCQNIGTTVTTV